MGIRFIALLLGAAVLMSLALFTTSCNKPIQDTSASAGASATSTNAVPAIPTASAGTPKLQYIGADW